MAATTGRVSAGAHALHWCTNVLQCCSFPREKHFIQFAVASGNAIHRDPVPPRAMWAGGAHIPQEPRPTCMLVATVHMGLVSSTFPQPARKATSREAGTPMSSLVEFVRRCRRATAICLQKGGAGLQWWPSTLVLMSLADLLRRCRAMKLHKGSRSSCTPQSTKGPCGGCRLAVGICFSNVDNVQCSLGSCHHAAPANRLSSCSVWSVLC